MLPIIAVILIVVGSCVQYDFSKCQNYNLVYEADYDIGEDLSNECQSNECIILTSQSLVNQDFINWCYQNTTVVAYSYTDCDGDHNWPPYLGRQVKLSCRSPQDRCSIPEISCIPDFLIYCNPNSKSYACPSSSQGTPTTENIPSTTTSSVTEDSCKETLSCGTTAPQETTSTETTPTKPSTTAPPFCDESLCPGGECFFRDHCYFISAVYAINEARNPLHVADICGQNQSLARGLAVETAEENDFIQALLRSSGNTGVFLTAAVRNSWSGWSSLLNQSVLIPYRGETKSPFITITYLDDEFFWSNLLHPPPLFAICERELVWSVALPWLRQSCYDEYMAQQCNRSFCCAADDENQIWFQCEGVEETVATKQCAGDLSNIATWTCFNGTFISEAPDTSQCHCDTPCSAEFGGEIFTACPSKYAYAPCPNEGKGYMRWQCLSNGSFDGIIPKMDLCCGNDDMFKRQDPFLNVWVACPNTTVTRYVECWNEENWVGNPSRYQLSWTCGPSGFLGATPDYSVCSDAPRCDETCDTVDNRGQRWVACQGELAVNPCPDGLKGSALWRCGNLSTFVGDSPDYSECYSSWVDDVEEMINNNNEAITIMNKIHEELNADSSGTGLKKVISVTSSCIDLFILQNLGNGSTAIFENFTTTYLDVLDDLTKNSLVWSLLSDARKDIYMDETIEMTNRICFGLKEVVSNEDIADYNRTFQSDETALSFRTVYSTTLERMNFPYEASKNMCSVELLQNFNPTPENTLFSAVGIVFPHLVSVAAFPMRSMANATIIMNSAVLSMTVADVSSNQPVKQKNVAMRVSFKHSMGARFPDRKIIPRRLHEGEEPSPIMGASQCFFYDTQQNPSTWSHSGCTVKWSSAEETICDCRHLTSFSVLVDVHDYIPDPALETFSLICSILSIIGLILTLIVFKAVKIRKLKLDTDRTLIDVNCCLCLLVSHCMIVTVLDKRFFYISDKMCSVVAGILHYFLTAAFFWMTVEAYHLYHLIVLVFTREGTSRTHYFIVGYILPIVPIMLTELAGQVLQKPAYGRDEICWLEVDFIWIFNGPAFLLTGLNLLVIIIAMRAAITKKENNSFQRWWIWCKGLAFLCTLLGVTWLVGLLYMEADVPLAVQYLFVSLNGLQGVYIFIFQCILNNQVRPVLVQFFLRRSKRTHHSSFSRISQKATAISSEVDSSAKTGTSTLESSSDVKIVPLQPGQWMFRANTPRRQWVNSNIIPCDDVVRQFQRRITQNTDQRKH